MKFSDLKFLENASLVTGQFSKMNPPFWRFWTWDYIGPWFSINENHGVVHSYYPGGPSIWQKEIFHFFLALAPPQRSLSFSIRDAHAGPLVTIKRSKIKKKSFCQMLGPPGYDRERREVLPAELWFGYINRLHYLHQEYLTWIIFYLIINKFTIVMPIWMCLNANNKREHLI